MIFTGRMDDLGFNIDINKCPIFFAYGDQAMSYWPELSNLIRNQFFTEEWLDKIKKNEKDGNGCKVVAFESDHWFFKRGYGAHYTTHLKMWLEGV